MFQSAIILGGLFIAVECNSLCDSINNPEKFAYKSHCYTRNRTLSTFADKSCMELDNGYMAILNGYDELTSVQRGLPAILVGELRNYYVNGRRRDVSGPGDSGWYFQGSESGQTKDYGPWPTKDEGWKLWHPLTPNNSTGDCMDHHSGYDSAMGFDHPKQCTDLYGVMCEYSLVRSADRPKDFQEFKKVASGQNQRMVKNTTIGEYKDYTTQMCAIKCGIDGGVCVGFSYKKRGGHCVLHLTDLVHNPKFVVAADGYEWYEWL